MSHKHIVITFHILHVSSPHVPFPTQNHHTSLTLRLDPLILLSHVSCFLFSPRSQPPWLFKARILIHIISTHHAFDMAMGIVIILGGLASTLYVPLPAIN